MSRTRHDQFDGDRDVRALMEGLAEMTKRVILNGWAEFETEFESDPDVTAQMSQLQQLTDQVVEAARRYRGRGRHPDA